MTVLHSFFLLVLTQLMKSAYKDLTDYVDVSRVKALNITKESNPAFLFEKCLNVIESRADPQILLMISFLSCSITFS